MPKSLTTRNSRSSRAEKQLKASGITQLARALLDPIIVWRGFSSRDVPVQIRTEVKLQRLLQIRATLSGQKIDKATDAEVLAYLMTASLENPLDSDWVDIYSYLARNYLKRKGCVVPKFLEGEGQLDEYQQRKLVELKRWIKRQQDNVLRQEIGARASKPKSCIQEPGGRYRQRKLDDFRSWDKR